MTTELQVASRRCNCLQRRLGRTLHRARPARILPWSGGLPGQRRLRGQRTRSPHLRQRVIVRSVPASSRAPAVCHRPLQRPLRRGLKSVTAQQTRGPRWCRRPMPAARERSSGRRRHAPHIERADVCVQPVEQAPAAMRWSASPHSTVVGKFTLTELRVQTPIVCSRVSRRDVQASAATPGSSSAAPPGHAATACGTEHAARRSSSAPPMSVKNGHSRAKSSSVSNAAASGRQRKFM